ncbi:zf-CCHC domain-containing protein/UBN2 domain-containing protein [Senna tora]|uniref:Zf-CCHC domain-containing protein/UBN2 domain-containing protein n=1 Tax=Senna tora TaxID=362788 RepID=A0A834TV01_9FABA|nr:zf-CCHC domain-containing protein/UBN2 domain-containing protein [Senna tora]
MYSRFGRIVNDLDALGKKFTNEELCHKIIRSLTYEWRPKVVAIQESAECQQLKGGKDKRKGLLSIWSDDEFPDDDEESKESPQKETANFCLMAKDSITEKDPEVIEANPHFDELLETYNTLLEDSLKILEKYIELKISHSKVLKAFGSMKLEKEALEEKIESMEEEYSMSALITENKKLKATIDKLNYDLEQFVKGEDKLNLILGSQRSPNDKTGLDDSDDPPEGLDTSECPQEEQVLVEESSHETDLQEAEPENQIELETPKEGVVVADSGWIKAAVESQYTKFNRVVVDRF